MTSSMKSSETLNLLRTHRSIRQYRSEPISDSLLDAIIEAGHRAPTSKNMQHLSVVVTRDAEKRAKIAEIAGGQPWIAKAPVFITVVVDFHKTGVAAELQGKTQLFQESLEAFMIAVLDAGIALEAMALAARAQGLGIVPIGAIRRDVEAMASLLKLPPLCFPVNGLVVGMMEEDAPLKPRLPLSAFRHDEVYHDEDLEVAIQQYDTDLKAHWEKLGRSNGLSWSEAMASLFGQPSTRAIIAAAQRLGFLKDYN